MLDNTGTHFCSPFVEYVLEIFDDLFGCDDLVVSRTFLLFFCLHVCALAEKEFGTVSQCCLGHFHLQKTDCLRFRKRFHSYDCFR
jgi:hypothetical protein